jgi:hypothetical protein
MERSNKSMTSQVDFNSFGLFGAWGLGVCVFGRVFISGRRLLLSGTDYAVEGESVLAWLGVWKESRC